MLIARVVGCGVPEWCSVIKEGRHPAQARAGSLPWVDFT